MARSVFRLASRLRTAILALVNSVRRFFLLLVGSVLLLGNFRAPAAVATNTPAVEITAEIEIIRWQYHEETGLPLKQRQLLPIRAVISTRDWLLERQPSTNVIEHVWFTRGHVLRQTSYRRATYGEDEDSTPARRYGRNVSVTESHEGHPGGNWATTLPWFAYLSGNFLNTTNRRVPLPTADVDEMAFGFVEKITRFDDALGLPRRATFHTDAGQLKLDYQVTQSTNVLGWNLPAQFTATQSTPDRFGKWNRQLTATGRLLTAQPAPAPALPADIAVRFEEWKTSPVRRR